MTTRPLGFRRLVLGLQPGAPDHAAELAVEFAQLLDAELLGLFLDDLGLRHLAAMPTARALSALGAGWRRLEPSQSLTDAAAQSAERRFAAVSRGLARRRFEIARGGAAQALTAISRSDDFVVIVPPAAADRAAEPFASLLAAAFGSAAAVMLAPARVARAAGAVVAIAASPDDPSVETASAIAEAAGERLVVVELRALAGDALRVERKRFTAFGGSTRGRSTMRPRRRRTLSESWPNA